MLHHSRWIEKSIPRFLNSQSVSRFESQWLLGGRNCSWERGVGMPFAGLRGTLVCLWLGDTAVRGWEESCLSTEGRARRSLAVMVPVCTPRLVGNSSACGAWRVVSQEMDWKMLLEDGGALRWEWRTGGNSLSFSHIVVPESLKPPHQRTIPLVSSFYPYRRW